MRHFSECVVVTTPEDEAVKAVVRSVPGARVSETDAFRRHGAVMNKGLAIEEAGFDVIGRHGFLCVHDADILFPDVLPLAMLGEDTLCGGRRRVLEDVSAWTLGLDWRSLPLIKDGSAPIGFAQFFSGDGPHLRGKRPWYDVSFPHSGGCDAAFIAHFPPGKRRVLPMEVLHLGPVDRNWFGTSQEARNLMAKYVYQNQWPRAMRNFTPEDAARAGDLPGRVSVPGYERSTFELPFERRARDAQK